ncbi:hypothetical protein [Mycobacterium avium]|uniref:hypothetical protein n=1 Tax=Mycobacterium avium TaxID=1764 RepID=UPI001CC488BE|nr:hypothetical protein [Mycobacterium avium]MBZ4618819.1 hypothetical protein [Mycobacterium avium subsp. hominissuis]
MPATLSQILAWSTEHLIEAAGYWTQTADRWEDGFLTMRNQAQSIAWRGAGGDALRERTQADLSVVRAKGDLLRQAAGIARNGASDISAAQRRVFYGVEDAQNAGFTVGEDLSVTDMRSTSPAERAARQAQAEAFAADIRLRAEQLESADGKVASQLTAATAGLGGDGFAPASSHNSRQPSAQKDGGRNRRSTSGVPNSQRGGVHLVDFKQDGGADPSPMPQPTPSQGQPQIGPFPVPPQVAAAAPKTPPPPPDVAAPPAPAGPSFGQCVGTEVKTNVGKDMIKDGFKSGAIKAGIGAAFGAGLTPELGGGGALPGAVLGFVGGFAQGLLEAPVEAAAKGALECSEDVPAWLKP